MSKENADSQSKSTPEKTEEENNNEDKNQNSLDLYDDEWMIRPCDIYYDEYDECKSFKGRFHQYFIFGEMLDCNQWKKDYDNCCKWKDSKNVKAKNEVIQSETKRRNVRLKAHYDNDIWNERKVPPKDWNNPLPEWIQKRDEMTYLSVKAKELRENSNIRLEPDKMYCCVM